MDMSLENRLKQLESKIVCRNVLPELPCDPDDFIRRLGLDPVAVRDAALNNRSSIVEAMCQALGIEPRVCSAAKKESESCEVKWT